MKRTALLGVVYQTLRYVDAIKRAQEEATGNLEDSATPPPVEGLIAAVNVRPTARALAEKKELPVLEIPYNWNPHPTCEISTEKSIVTT